MSRIVVVLVQIEILLVCELRQGIRVDVDVVGWGGRGEVWGGVSR